MFSIDQVCEVLLKESLVTREQRLEVSMKERMQRSRLAVERSRDLGPQAPGTPRRRPDITPVELIASFNFPVQRGAPGETLSEERIMRALAKDAGLPFVKIDPLKLDSKLVTSVVSRPFARRHLIVPLQLAGRELTIATANPYDDATLTQLRHATSYEIRPVVATKTDIMKIITEFYGFRTSVTQAARELGPKIDLGNLEQLIKLKDVDEIEATDKHIVNAVEYLLHYAFGQRASDIHIEPKRDVSHIRLRIDGVLHNVHTMPRVVHNAIVSRLKMLARLDIAEKRKPQDGRIKTTLKQGTEVEIRVSSLPVAFGEKLVLRIFDPEAGSLSVEDLGFFPRDLELFHKLINLPYGLILVTGPTGSGKTTTLYAALRTVARPEVNITTIEDPIEMVCEEFNQVAVQSKIDVTFGSTLRNILRQDPDIIMVGEIRDPETARNAIQSALTGHLVFSTLHTNTAVDAVTRLIDLGIEPFLIASSVLGIAAQRLMRTICPGCKTARDLDPEEMRLLGLRDDGGKPVTIHYGAGCPHCRGTGYYGRTGIFEMFELTDEIANLVKTPGNEEKIRKAALKDGMKTLREASVLKMIRGETTFEEVMRVTMD